MRKEVSRGALALSMLAVALSATSGAGAEERSWIGIDVTDSIHLGIEDGVTVIGVHPGQPAALSGLSRGDVILEIDQRKIFSASQLVCEIASRAPGERVHVLARRGERATNADLTIGSWPAYMLKTPRDCDRPVS